MNVIFAPDYREGNPYQQMLADALKNQGVSIQFLSDYRRAMPLWRGVRDLDGDLLHLHWPEKYYQRRADNFDLFRRFRYPIDLRLALRGLPLVLTAHDLLPHNRVGESMLHRNHQSTLDRAEAVFVHSPSAIVALSESYRINVGKCHVVRHGDLSESLPLLPERAESRALLDLPQSQSICLMFGRVEPYKGIEEVIDWWQTQTTVTLAVVGQPLSNDYADHLRRLVRRSARVLLSLEWQPQEQFRRWLASADCVLFNYTAILSSGAACEARSYGVPVLLPSRLRTIDLMEPHPLVFRFQAMDSDFGICLSKALLAGRNYESSGEWREATSWRKVAQATSQLYRAVVDAKPSRGTQ